MFEGRHRLYIGECSDPPTADERKQIIPDHSTIEDFYRVGGSPKLLRRQNDAFTRHFTSRDAAICRRGGIADSSGPSPAYQATAIILPVRFQDKVPAPCGWYPEPGPCHGVGTGGEGWSDAAAHSTLRASER
jgi:hypothetical protein